MASTSQAPEDRIKALKCSIEDPLSIKVYAHFNVLLNTIIFDPPVFRQRYASTMQILTDQFLRKEISKVVDLGSSEMGMFVFLKQLDQLSELYLVDIDMDTILQHMYRLLPLTYDYLQRRSKPFVIQVLAGSCDDPDHRIANVDAVLAIEIIEHLFPDTLDALPYNIFHYISPKLVIATTPNADFNVVFPNFKGIRHDDHKFEWTRQQFEDWANNIVLRFPNYFVIFKGIGWGPMGTEALGCCSQMAVFIRKDIADPVAYGALREKPVCTCGSEKICLCPPSKSFGVCTYETMSKTLEFDERNEAKNVFYRPLKTVEYPYEIDTRSEEEKLSAEVKYRISVLGTTTGRFYNEENYRAEVPIHEIATGLVGIQISEQELTDFLVKEGYEIEECTLFNSEIKAACVIYKPDERVSSSEGGSLGYSQYSGLELSQNIASDESNWDTGSDA